MDSTFDTLCYVLIKILYVMFYFMFKDIRYYMNFGLFCLTYKMNNIPLEGFIQIQIINKIINFTNHSFQFILVFNWIEYKPASSGSYVYPNWANAVGWVIAFFPVVVIILMMLYKLCTITKRPFREVCIFHS